MTGGETAAWCAAGACSVAVLTATHAAPALAAAARRRLRRRAETRVVAEAEAVLRETTR